jgi:DNA-binding transcriptional LysR family regulator
MLAYPGVNIDLRERSTSDIAKALKEGAADVGILASDTAIDGLCFMAYRSERLVLVTARHHPLSHDGPVEFGQTLGNDYIGLKDTTALHTFIKRAATQLGATLRFRIQVNTFEVLCNLVESGIGVALIPESIARRYAKTLAIEIIPLRDAWAERALQIAVRDGRTLSAAEQALIDELIASVGD